MLAPMLVSGCGNAVPRLTSADDEARRGDKPDPVVAVLETAGT